MHPPRHLLRQRVLRFGINTPPSMDGRTRTMQVR
jgi:hypothetical protein